MPGEWIFRGASDHVGEQRPSAQEISEELIEAGAQEVVAEQDAHEGYVAQVSALLEVLRQGHSTPLRMGLPFVSAILSMIEPCDAPQGTECYSVLMAAEIIHEVLPVGLLQCNCSIIGDAQTREALLVDPGDDAD